MKATCQESGLLDKLHEIQQKQDECKKRLSEFLDGKRRQFPRFFFMSEADVLNLLSNSSPPAKVLEQVCKVVLVNSLIPPPPLLHALFSYLPSSFPSFLTNSLITFLFLISLFSVTAILTIPYLNPSSLSSIITIETL